MKNIYKKFQAALFVVMALAGTACDDKDDSGSVPPPSTGPEATPVELTVSNGYYYGQGDALSCDHYTLFLSNGEVVEEDKVFTGEGTGVCLNIYAPIRENMELPDGNYEVRQPLIQSWLYTINPKNETDSSYIFKGPDKVPLIIVSGAVTIGQSGTNYTVSGTVRCNDDNYYALNYSGTLNLVKQDLPYGWDTEYADYTDMPRCAGIYFGSMMTPDNDNYSFYLMSENVVDLGGTFDGFGEAVSFDLYAPLGTGVDPGVGVYTVYNKDTDTSLDFRYKKGEDYGEGMLQGSFIFKRASAEAEKEYAYIIGGALTIETKKDFYRVLIDVQGDDDVTYKFKYIGKSLNILDPFGGM